MRISIQHERLHEKRLVSMNLFKKKKACLKALLAALPLSLVWVIDLGKMHLSFAGRAGKKDANEFSHLNFYLQFIPASPDSCTDSAE